jgi:hypothetical protein
MNFPGNLGERAVKDVVLEHPDVGNLLQKYDIGCVTCGVGICLLKDVVSIHGLAKDVEDKIEAEIAQLVNGRKAQKET